jgi:hypothetical protein
MRRRRGLVGIWLGRGALMALVASLIGPAAADAGTAISTVPNLPGGARAGGVVTVGEQDVPGVLHITQIFNGADTGAMARVRLIRMAVNCGPGPSPGNPSANGPAINDPERPCTNPDPDVFGNLNDLGVGDEDCAGIAFTIIGPDADGQVDLVPNFPVDLHDGETCEIDFGFDVLNTPALDTFPGAAGMQTTTVSSVRSQVVSDPGNPAAVGLQAAGLGSGDAVLVEAATPPSTTESPPDTTPNRKKKTPGTPGPPTKLRTPHGCVKTTLDSSVTGSDITKVSFILDGELVDVDKTAPFKLNMVLRDLSKGRHRLNAIVAYRPSADRPDRVLKRQFYRCGSPNFTG